MEENRYVEVIYFTISIYVGCTETMVKVYGVLIDRRVQPQGSSRSNLQRNKT